MKKKSISSACKKLLKQGLKDSEEIKSFFKDNCTYEIRSKEAIEEILRIHSSMK